MGRLSGPFFLLDTFTGIEGNFVSGFVIRQWIANGYAEVGIRLQRDGAVDWSEEEK